MEPSGDGTDVERAFWLLSDETRIAILRLLRAHGVVPPEATPRLRFRSFDWSFDPRRFADG